MSLQCEFQASHKVVCGKKLRTHHGSVHCHIFWWHVCLHSYLAIILGLSNLFEVFSLVVFTARRINVFSRWLAFVWSLFRVVNDTLESISLELGFSGSTMAEGAPSLDILLRD